jgi:hypothetical protein
METMAITGIQDINNVPTVLHVDGMLDLNGRDLEDRLCTIEQLLGLPVRDVDLEVKFPHLVDIYEGCVAELVTRVAESTALHKKYTDEIEKAKTWERLSNEY